jgi:hypothetical protein
MAIFYVSTAGSNTAPYDTWAKAATTLATAVTASAANDEIRLASDETQTLSAATTYIVKSATKIVSVNKTTDVQEAGAIIEFTGVASTAELRFTSSVGTDAYSWLVGVTIRFGKSGVTHTLRASINMENCTLYRDATAALNLEGSSKYRNCTFSNNTGVTSAIGTANSQGSITYTDCIFFSSGGVPSPVFGAHVGLFASGCDFSTCQNLYASQGIVGAILFHNCKLHATPTFAAQTSANGPLVRYHACSSGDHSYNANLLMHTGSVIENTGVYLTSGGATISDVDGSDVPLSHMLVSSAKAYAGSPLYSEWFYTKITATGSKTFDIKIAHTLGAALKDNEAWIEVEFMGDASLPTFNNAISAPVLSGTDIPDLLAAGSNLSDTAEAWTGITSEITHTLSKTVTVNQQGWARARVALGKASTTIYVNPTVTVS